MSRRVIWWLSVVIAIVTAGLVLIQSQWVRMAYKVKQEQLYQSAGLALERMVKAVGQQETVVEFIEEFDPQTPLDRDSPARLTYHFSSINRTRSGIHTFERRQQAFTLGRFDTLTLPSSLRVGGTDSLRIVHLGNQQLGILSTNRARSLGEFNLHVATDGRQGDKNVYVENIVDKTIRIEMAVHERIPQPALDSIIHHELRGLGIRAKYEYRVSIEPDSTVYQSEGFGASAPEIALRGDLFPDDFFSPRATLTLYFPHQETYILASMGLMTLTTLLLTLIIIASFASTLLIIFRQKRLSEIKSDFVSNMTHELKTPISTISLASQMLNDTSIPAERKNLDYLGGVISEESQRLGHHVEKVLQMAIFERAKLKLKAREVDINRLIDRAVSTFRIQLNGTGGQIDLRLSAAAPVCAADEAHLTNVINNLLDNALKYRNGSPKIEVASRDAPRGVIFEVRDNGIGISRENQKRIFEQFYRAPTGNVHNVKGFGLGLSYVKRIVDAHGGRIWVESKPHEGSRFSVYIPHGTPKA